MKYRLRHVTEYHYGRPVDLGAHMLHLRPRHVVGQKVTAAALTVDPPANRHSAALDHFGNPVDWLFLETPHRHLEIVSEASIEVRIPDPPEAARTPAWETIGAAARRGGPGAWSAAEFLYPSPLIAAEPLAGAYAAPSFPPGRPILVGLVELMGRIRRDFAFRAGVTTLSTPVSATLERRQGVCQDFAHLMIAALRALDIPARYVSGYIRTIPAPGKPRRRGVDQSHAWVSAWLGPDHGWVDLDPTNDAIICEDHLVVGWGRDFADVSPVRGIILGGGKHKISVSVDVIQGDEAEADEVPANAG